MRKRKKIGKIESNDYKEVRLFRRSSKTHEVAAAYDSKRSMGCTPALLTVVVLLRRKTKGHLRKFPVVQARILSA